MHIFQTFKLQVDSEDKTPPKNGLRILASLYDSSREFDESYTIPEANFNEEIVETHTNVSYYS